MPTPSRTYTATHNGHTFSRTTKTMLYSHAVIIDRSNLSHDLEVGVWGWSQSAAGAARMVKQAAKAWKNANVIAVEVDGYDPFEHAHDVAVKAAEALEAKRDALRNSPIAGDHDIQRAEMAAIDARDEANARRADLADHVKWQVSALGAEMVAAGRESEYDQACNSAMENAYDMGLREGDGPDAGLTFWRHVLAEVGFLLERGETQTWRCAEHGITLTAPTGCPTCTAEQNGEITAEPFEWTDPGPSPTCNGEWFADGDGTNVRHADDCPACPAHGNVHGVYYRTPVPADDPFAEVARSHDARAAARTARRAADALETEHAGQPDALLARTVAVLAGSSHDDLTVLSLRSPRPYVREAAALLLATYTDPDVSREAPPEPGRWPARPATPLAINLHAPTSMRQYRRYADNLAGHALPPHADTTDALVQGHDGGDVPPLEPGDLPARGPAAAPLLERTEGGWQIRPAAGAGGGAGVAGPTFARADLNRETGTFTWKAV